MYRWAGFIKFIVVFAVVFWTLTQHQYLGLFLFMPFWFLMEYFDNAKRGSVIFKKYEFEKGPFEEETLPLGVRRFFSEGDAFLASKGFLPKEEVLITSGTMSFGRYEIKILSKLFEEKGSGTNASMNFCFLWEPATQTCRLVSLKWGFSDHVSGKNRRTLNVVSCVDGYDTATQQTRYLSVADPAELYENHRRWIETLGTRDRGPERDLWAEMQEVYEGERKTFLGSGLLFEDVEQGAYRYTFKGVFRIVRMAIVGRKLFIDQDYAKGLKPFKWRIHPPKESGGMRSLLPDRSIEEPERYGSRVAVFSLRLSNAFWALLFRLMSGPWLVGFAIIALYLGAGSVGDLLFRFSDGDRQGFWLNLAGCAAGAVVTMTLLMVVTWGLMGIFVLSDRRKRDQYGSRRLKFSEDVICYESAHALTTCALKNFPSVRRCGKLHWVRFANADAFVVRPGDFEADGYRIFREEMTRLGLMRPFHGTRWFLGVLVLSVGMLVYGSFHWVYSSYSYQAGDSLGVGDERKATLFLGEQRVFSRCRSIARWWIPLAPEIHDMSQGYQGRIEGTLCVIDGMTLRKIPVHIAGHRLRLAVLEGGKVFVAVEDWATGILPFPKRVYRLEPDRLVEADGEEAKAVEVFLGQKTVRYPKGWDKLVGPDCVDPRVEVCEVELPGPFTYFKTRVDFVEDPHSGYAEGILKEGKEVYRREIKWQDIRRKIEWEEYESALRGGDTRVP